MNNKNDPIPLDKNNDINDIIDSDIDSQFDSDDDISINENKKNEDDNDEDDDNQNIEDDDLDIQNLDEDNDSDIGELPIETDENISNIVLNRNDDDDDDDLEEDYLQKINKENYDNTLSNYHPELKIHNIDEIKAMTTIVRDKFGNIIDPLHKTLPFITCYEKARILGERTKQLNQGAKPFVEVEHDVIDGYLIALKEFEEKKIPFIVQRPLPNGTSEYWKFCDLECLE
tara:strand:+ start:10756 stop:11442 length:687 start_codon:yes stop_codon:yes gene_type:complete